MISFLWLVPSASFVLAIITAAFMFLKYLQKHGTQHLFWAIGMFLYAAGSLAEALYILLGWREWIFRIWYLCGAILVAAWLGQGTILLLVRRKIAAILSIVLLLASIFAAWRIFTAQLDPNLLSVETGLLSGAVITSPGVRILTPFFNIYGTLALIGGAIYSVVGFWRKRSLPHRAVGTALIALGAFFPAMGGTLNRLGYPEGLYFFEMAGAILLLAGTLRSVKPFRSKRLQTEL
jgi:hypothetical protein